MRRMGAAVLPRSRALGGPAGILPLLIGAALAQLTHEVALAAGESDPTPCAGPRALAPPAHCLSHRHRPARNAAR